MIGNVLKGLYKVYDQVGSGGLATVFLARNLQTNQIVAVKVLRADEANDPEMRTRFEREAKLMADLDDVHFVRLLDYGVEETLPFLVMEFVEGKTLKAVIKERGAFPAADALRVTREVAEGLAALHRRGVIHRDVKPQNIMIRPDGLVKLMDFGIAKVGNLNSVTQTGFMVGTPHYISPEQALGRPVDQRADIYSLGVVSYEMLTGNVLFDADSPFSVLLKHIQDPVPADWLQRHRVAPPVAQIVDRCLSKDPAGRYQHVEELLAAIDRLAGESGARLARPTAAASAAQYTPQPESLMNHPPAVGEVAAGYAFPATPAAVLPAQGRRSSWGIVLLLGGGAVCLLGLLVAVAVFYLGGKVTLPPAVTTPNLGAITPWVTRVLRQTPGPGVVAAPSSTPLVISADGAVIAAATATRRSAVGRIALQVTPMEPGLWTVVQWQDRPGRWNDVDTWRSALASGRQDWEVYPTEFGKGPFRWLVYEAKTKRVRGLSEPFYLPRNAGSAVMMRVQLQSSRPAISPE